MRRAASTLNSASSPESTLHACVNPILSIVPACPPACLPASFPDSYRMPQPGSRASEVGSLKLVGLAQLGLEVRRAKENSGMVERSEEQQDLPIRKDST